jgi:hypothetical protein
MINSKGVLTAGARKKRMGPLKNLAFSILCSLVILATALLALLALLEQAVRFL